MNTFQAGEIVDITIKGARIMQPKPGEDGTLTLAYEQVEPGVFATIDLRHPKAQSVSIERVAPAEWPPVVGDLWRDGNGRVWFAYDATDYDDGGPVVIRLHSTSTHSYGTFPPDEANRRYGPMTLVRRESGSGS